MKLIQLINSLNFYLESHLLTSHYIARIFDTNHTYIDFSFIKTEVYNFPNDGIII